MPDVLCVQNTRYKRWHDGANTIASRSENAGQVACKSVRSYKAYAARIVLSVDALSSTSSGPHEVAERVVRTSARRVRIVTRLLFLMIEGFLVKLLIT